MTHMRAQLGEGREGCELSVPEMGAWSMPRGRACCLRAGTVVGSQVQGGSGHPGGLFAAQNDLSHVYLPVPLALPSVLLGGRGTKQALLLAFCALLTRKLRLGRWCWWWKVAAGQPCCSTRPPPPVSPTGAQYWVYDGEKPVLGPAPLSELGLRGSPIHAALVWGSEKNKIYFFRSGDYWRFQPSARRVDSPVPRRVTDWRGVPSEIDAAFQDAEGVRGAGLCPAPSHSSPPPAKDCANSLCSIFVAVGTRHGMETEARAQVPRVWLVKSVRGSGLCQAGPRPWPVLT